MAIMEMLLDRRNYSTACSLMKTVGCVGISSTVLLSHSPCRTKIAVSVGCIYQIWLEYLDILGRNGSLWDVFIKYKAT